MLSPGSEMCGGTWEVGDGGRREAKLVSRRGTSPMWCGVVWCGVCCGGSVNGQACGIERGVGGGVPWRSFNFVAGLRDLPS